MRATVLGKSPAWQDSGGACSGYLVEADGSAVVLDCGNGVFGKLRSWRDYVAVDAIVVSHMHADHFLDLIPYAYALTYAPRQQPVPVDRWPGTSDPARPRLHLPAGGAGLIRRVVGSWGDEDLVDRAFEVSEYEPDDVCSAGPFEIRFCPVPHFVPTCAIEVREVAGGSRLTFGADCAPNEELVDFARDSDLLLIESTLPRPERVGPRGHLTPSEAGEIGRRAGAAQVVLTHVSDELDELWVRRQGEEAFGAPLTVAHEGDSYEV